MASNRIGRINEEIQRELASRIPALKDPRVHGLVSITRVDTTADLRYCRVYVSVLDKSDVKDVIRGLKSAGGYLRRELGRALSLRYTPELIFQADDSIDRGTHILKLLNEIENREGRHDSPGSAGAADAAGRHSDPHPPPAGRRYHRLRCSPVPGSVSEGQDGMGAAQRRCPRPLCPLF